MSGEIAEDGPNDPALNKAVEILEREDEQVIGNIFRLLTEASGAKWDAKHTTNVLGVLSDHLEKVTEIRKYEIDCNERMSARKQLPLIMGMTFVGAIALCWMFLHYGKPEFIVAVITGITGFLGGYGYARGEKKG